MRANKAPRDELARLEALHKRARALRGERMWLYRSARFLLRPWIHLLFRPQIEGRERIRQGGGLLLVSNHRSFLDSFFQAYLCKRPMHWMAKKELFQPAWKGWLMSRMGAFPVRRGESDALALETALHLLQAGEMVALFPEGTRVREGLGTPHRGAGRLALQARVPLLPMGISGTERGALRAAIWHPGHRVRVRIGLPIFPPSPPDVQSAQTRELAEELI